MSDPAARGGVCYEARHSAWRRSRMGVQVGRVHTGMHDAVSHGIHLVVHVAAAVHPCRLVTIGECYCGSVEFVSNYPLAR